MCFLHVQQLFVSENHRSRHSGQCSIFILSKSSRKCLWASLQKDVWFRGPCVELSKSLRYCFLVGLLCSKRRRLLWWFVSWVSSSVLSERLRAEDCRFKLFSCCLLSMVFWRCMRPNMASSVTIVSNVFHWGNYESKVTAVFSSARWRGIHD